MQDRKALQSGTSHFLGQNFSKAQEIAFQDENGQLVHAWTTSWGVSTRLVGGLIMTHADDDGLVLPPRLAPKHVVILPIYRGDDERADVLTYCESLQSELVGQTYDGAPVRVAIDDRDLRGGEKRWQHVKRGVPLVVEVGPRDVAGGGAYVGRRDTGERKPQPRVEFIAGVSQTLAEIQRGLFERALALREENTRSIDDADELRAFFTPANEKKPELHGGFALSHVVDLPEVDEILKKLKVSIRCIPLAGDDEPGQCLFTGQTVPRRAVLAKAY